MQNWLEQIVVQQNAIAAAMYGNPRIISQAAKATDHFTEDELEASARQDAEQQQVKQ